MIKFLTVEESLQLAAGFFNNRRMMWLFAAFLVMGTGMFPSCAYRFSGADRAPFGIQKISVHMLENRTSETGIEAIFANDLIYELTRDGRMKITDRSKADAIVCGVIRKMYIGTETHERSYVALEREVRIIVDLVLQDREGNILWSGNNLSDRETYLVSQNQPATEKNRRAAIAEISRKMAQKVYQRLIWQ